MSNDLTAQVAPAPGNCPVKTVLDLATEAAEALLGTDGANRRVAARATLETKVTEGGKTDSQRVDATVGLGVTCTSGSDTACCCSCDCGCCLGCGLAGGAAAGAPASPAQQTS